MEHLLLKATITAATDQGEFTAVISTVAVDRDRDIVEPAAVVAALNKWVPTGKKVPLSWNHSVEAEDIIGHIDPRSAKAVNGEVVVDGWVDQSIERGKHAWRLVKSGTLGFSYGYLVPAGGAVKRPTSGGLHIKELDIFEITATPIPANGETRVLAFKSAETLREEANRVERETQEEQIPDIRRIEEPPHPLMKALADIDPNALTPEQIATTLDRLEIRNGTQDVHLYVRVITGDEAEGVKSGDIKAVWTTAYINNLPDSAFLHIEPGGSKDSEGKTTPRSLRHFPVKDADGNVDMPHLRNALSRIPQSNLPQDVKDRCTAKAQRMMDQQKSVDETDKAPRARSVDPLREQAGAVELEFASGGESLRKPPSKVTPKPADLVPLDDLKQRMRDEMLRYLSGDIENGK